MAIIIIDVKPWPKDISQNAGVRRACAAVNSALGSPPSFGDGLDEEAASSSSTKASPSGPIPYS